MRSLIGICEIEYHNEDEKEGSLNLEATVQFAVLEDLDAWMQLIDLVRDNFPGLETEELLEGYRQTVTKNIYRQTAICTKQGDEVIGLLLFSYHAKCLSCMAVHPNHRREGIATAMIEKMLELFPAGVDISVTTFRVGDPKGVAPRPLYRKFGFVEDELTNEFNYPHQKFVLHGKRT
jgi:GNAT superfamily N-acetyltransferase